RLPPQLTIGQELGDNRRRVEAHILHEWLTLRVEDHAPRGQNLRRLDVVVPRSLGVFLAVHNLQIRQAYNEDAEKYHHRDAESVEIAVRPHTCRWAVATPAFE